MRQNPESGTARLGIELVTTAEDAPADGSLRSRPRKGLGISFIDHIRWNSQPLSLVQ